MTKIASFTIDIEALQMLDELATTSGKTRSKTITKLIRTVYEQQKKSTTPATNQLPEVPTVEAQQ